MIPNVLIATPIRGANIWTAQVTVGYSECVRMLSRVAPVSTFPGILTFGCDNIRARNKIAAKVLRESPAVTHVLWWDDDQWPEDMDSTPKLILDMIGTGEHLIGAPYTNKCVPARFVHQHLWPQAAPEPGGLQEVRCLGFGFTITSRACLEKMSKKARKYTDVDGREPPYHKVANLFGQLYDKSTPNSTDEEDEILLSEDYSFCKRWRDMGGRVMLYTNGVVMHSGGYAYGARDVPVSASGT